MTLEWKQSLLPLSITDHEIHIWRMSMVQSNNMICFFDQILSDHERERLKRYQMEASKKQFLVSRGFLKILLGRYLNIEPSQINLIYNDYGKPGLKQYSSAMNIQFNLSHSHNLVVYALTMDRNIGIDLEYIRPIADLDNVIAKSFSSKEEKLLRQISPAEKEQAFFRFWTCKEAFIKAKGFGINRPMSGIQFGLGNRGQINLLGPDDNDHETSDWSLYEIIPENGYQAAIAVKGGHYQLSYLDGNSSW